MLAHQGEPSRWGRAARPSATGAGKASAPQLAAGTSCQYNRARTCAALACCASCALVGAAHALLRHQDGVPLVGPLGKAVQADEQRRSIA